MLRRFIRNIANTHNPALEFIRPYIPPDISKNDFVLKMTSLLDMANAAEKRIKESDGENQETKNTIVSNLELKSQEKGFYGRIITRFVSTSSEKQIFKDLRPGEWVDVVKSKPRTNQEQKSTIFQAHGIVSRIFPSCIEIIHENQNHKLDQNGCYELLKIEDDSTLGGMKRALEELLLPKTHLPKRVIDICFSRSEISKPNPTMSIDFVNKSLDKSQKEAVNFAMRQKEVAIIHGPPGTGKTTTLVELIHQSVMLGQKVLVASYTNIAVDNISDKLGQIGLNVLRVGHPVRFLPEAQVVSLDAAIFNSKEKEIERKLHEHLIKMKKMLQCAPKNSKTVLKAEINLIKREMKQLDLKVSKNTVNSADVILTTLLTCNHHTLKHLRKKFFDLVVIDECSQAFEAASWIALLKAPKCILAGDHLQLGPIIHSTQAAKEGLEQSLMERLIKLFKMRNDDVVRTLTTQYRMHEYIMKWSSDQFYNGQLTAHPTVADHLLRDLHGVSDSILTNSPLLLLDTAGCELTELSHDGEYSISNRGEAELVALHVHFLISLGITPADIAVISPYTRQIKILRDELTPHYSELEIKTVDGFQGREKEAVIISLVRSNSNQNVGFLSEKRRMNVAVTRARRNLTLVCDTKTVCHDKLIRTIVELIRSKGKVLTPKMYREIERRTGIKAGKNGTHMEHNTHQNEE